MKKIITILLMLLFMACTTYPTPTPSPTRGLTPAEVNNLPATAAEVNAQGGINGKSITDAELRVMRRIANPCKYKTVSIYDQSCLNSVSGEWVEDSQSGAMVNKTHRKFCWSTGTKQVKYDCKEPENTQAQKAGTWKLTGGGPSAACGGPFIAEAEIWANGYGHFSGRGFSHKIYIDQDNNVSSSTWKRFKGACSSNSYCSGTYKYTRRQGTCVGTWEGKKLY